MKAMSFASDAGCTPPDRYTSSRRRTISLAFVTFSSWMRRAGSKAWGGIGSSGLSVGLGGPRRLDSWCRRDGGEIVVIPERTAAPERSHCQRLREVVVRQHGRCVQPRLRPPPTLDVGRREQQLSHRIDGTHEILLRQRLMLLVLVAVVAVNRRTAPRTNSIGLLMRCRNAYSEKKCRDDNILLRRAAMS